MSRRPTAMTRSANEARPPAEPTALLTQQARQQGYMHSFRLARASDQSRPKFWNAIDKTLGAFKDDPDVADALAIGPDVVRSGPRGDRVRATHNVHEIRVGPKGRFIGVWFDKGRTRFMFVLDTAVKETLKKDDYTSADAQSLNAFTNAFCQLLDGTFARPNGQLAQADRPRVLAAGTDRLMRNPRHAATTQAKLQDLQSLVLTHDGQLDLLTKEGRMQWAIKSLLHSDEAETIAARNLVGELNRLRRGRYPRDAKLAMTGYRRLKENDPVPPYIDYDRAYGEEGLVVPDESQRDVVCLLWWYGVRPHISEIHIANRLGRDFGVTSKDQQPISTTVLPDLTAADRELLTRLNQSSDPAEWTTKPLHLLSEGGKRQAIKAMYQPHKIATYATGVYAAEWTGRVANQFTYEGGHTMTPRVREANDAYGSATFDLPFGLPPQVEIDRTTGLPVRDADGNPTLVVASSADHPEAATPLFGWGPTFDDWLEVLATRSFRPRQDGAKQAINAEHRHPLSCFGPWARNGREWVLEARSSDEGTDYCVRSRPLESRHDELRRYRSWARSGHGTTVEVLTPASELERALAADLTAASTGLILGSLAGVRILKQDARAAVPDPARAIAATKAAVARLERDARALRLKVSLLTDADKRGEVEVDGDLVEDLPDYRADLEQKKNELAAERNKLTRLETPAAPAQPAPDPIEGDYSNVAWVIAALRRTRGKAVDPRLAAALQNLITDLRLERTPDVLAAQLTYTLRLPLSDGATADTTRRFTISNKQMGTGARPAARRQRNDAVATLFLRDGLSIDAISARSHGAIDPALAHRALAEALTQLLPGRAQGARRFVRHAASPRHRQAIFHALTATPASQRPDWLGAPFDPYLHHLANVLRTGTVSIEDIAIGRRQEALLLLLGQPDPAQGMSVQEISDALGVRPLTASIQAVNTVSRKGPHPATLAKVSYYDNTTAPIDAQPPRMRPIRCAYDDCPAPWASTVLWLPELLALGTGVVCPDCRRPSKVVYTPSRDADGTTTWELTDATAGEFPIPSL